MFVILDWRQLSATTVKIALEAAQNRSRRLFLLNLVWRSRLFNGHPAVTGCFSYVRVSGLPAATYYPLVLLVLLARPKADGLPVTPSLIAYRRDTDLLLHLLPGPTGKALVNIPAHPILADSFSRREPALRNWRMFEGGPSPGTIKTGVAILVHAFFKWSRSLPKTFATRLACSIAKTSIGQN